MRTTRLRTLAVLGALIVSLLLVTSGLSPAGAEQPRPTLYHVTQFGSLGGTTSAGNSINNRGWIAGSSNLAGDTMTHATLWREVAEHRLPLKRRLEGQPKQKAAIGDQPIANAAAGP
jgi:hypothetical protein